MRALQCGQSRSHSCPTCTFRAKMITPTCQEKTETLSPGACFAATARTTCGLSLTPPALLSNEWATAAGSDEAPVSSCCPVAAVAPATAHTQPPPHGPSAKHRDSHAAPRPQPYNTRHLTAHVRMTQPPTHLPNSLKLGAVVPLSRLSSRSCQAFPAPTAWRWGTLGATLGRSDATQGLVLSPRETPARLPAHTAAHTLNVSHTQSTPLG
jgi:hypothetical protein